MIKIEVAYADVDRQVIYSVDVEEGCTIEQAITASPLLKDFPHIGLANSKVGVFGVQKKMETVLHQGDRVEVYRDLIIDPKQARLNRLAKKKQPK